MSKTVLTSVATFKTFSKKPVLVAIGKDAEGYFKRLTLEQFFDMQDKLMSVEKSVPELPEEDKKDMQKANDRTRQIVQKTKSVVVALMLDLMTDEKGEPAFTEKDTAELEKMVTPAFSRDFVGALMLSQGVGQEDISLAEDSFRQR